MSEFRHLTRNDFVFVSCQPSNVCVSGQLEAKEEGDKEEKEDDKATRHLGLKVFYVEWYNFDIILYRHKLHNIIQLILTCIVTCQRALSIDIIRYSLTWLNTIT